MVAKEGNVTAFVRVLQDIGLFVARVAFGVVMVLHGWARWNGSGGMAAQVAHLEASGIAQPQLVAWGTVLLEVIGGVLLVFGAFTPGVALFFLVQQVLVIALIKWHQGIYLESGGFEYNLVTAAAAALFLVFGSGRAGVDTLFRRPAAEKTPRTGRAVDDRAPA